MIIIYIKILFFNNEKQIYLLVKWNVKNVFGIFTDLL